MRDFRDEQALRSTYYSSIERLVREATGATRVLIFDHTHRSSAVGRRASDGTDIVVDEAHNDYTEGSGPRRVRELLAGLAPGEDPEMMRGRYAVFKVWRPTNGSVDQWPLAACDMQSMRPTDFVDAELKWRDRTGYVCAVRHRPDQRWLHVSAMDVEEALVFKCYDSAVRDGGTRFGAHSAFADPASPDGARLRESIEVRTIALFAGQ